MVCAALVCAGSRLLTCNARSPQMEQQLATVLIRLQLQQLAVVRFAVSSVVLVVVGDTVKLTTMSP